MSLDLYEFALLANALVCEERKFIYMCIPKNASTSVKAWILGLSGEKNLEQYNKDEIHLLASKKYSFIDRTLRMAYQLLQEMPVVLFVRNPYERLLSTYINKFIYEDYVNFHNKMAIEGWSRWQGMEFECDHPHSIERGGDHYSITLKMNISYDIDYRKSLTFRQFVNYIDSLPESFAWDYYWLPQAKFTTLLNPSYVYKVEEIDQGLADFSKVIGVDYVPVRFLNKSARNFGKHSFENLADKYPTELRDADVNFSSDSFFDDDLCYKVNRIYKEDFQRFNYSVKVPSLD